MILTIDTAKGPVARVTYPALVIKDGSTFLEVLYSTDCEVVVFDQTHFPPEFWELKTKLAGEILQKVSNYRRKIIILGDFSNTASNSLRDFIRESNRFGTVIFSETLDEGVGLLR